MMCSNCMEDREDVFMVLPEKKYSACPKCSVNYAKDRTGFAFMLDDEVFIPTYHSKTESRVFVVKGIFIFEECESGRMIYLVDKETQRPLKSILDTNWLKKVNKN